MAWIIEERDPAGKPVKLSTERWKHITRRHPEVSDLELIRRAIVAPHRVQPLTEGKTLYVLSLGQATHLHVIAKFLTDEAYIVTAYVASGIK